MLQMFQNSPTTPNYFMLSHFQGFAYTFSLEALEAVRFQEKGFKSVSFISMLRKDNKSRQQMKAGLGNRFALHAYFNAE